MWDYRAQLTRPYDGDSFFVLIDQGMGGRQEEELRLLNVSAPELDELGGPEARAFVAEWMAKLPPLRWPLLVATVPTARVEPTERRTFVRYLATVRDIAVPGRCLNTDLAAYLAGHPEWGPGM